MTHTSMFLVLILLLTHCKPKEASISDADKEMLSSLRAIQAEHNFSDEELTQAVARYCKIFRVMEGAIDDGLVTMEDYRNMPAMLREVQDNMLESDSMAAHLSLAVLKSHKENDPERLLPSLRKVVASYYNDLKHRGAEDDTGFMRKVESYAGDDESLSDILNQ